MENLLFSFGRHYLEDALQSKLLRNADNLSTSDVTDISRTLPKPVNDILGRYIETNVALLTENKPIPRITSKSDEKRDRDSAELSELNIHYLWEALGMPEKQREAARLMLVTGTCWVEVCYDPAAVRTLAIPEMTQEETEVTPPEIPDLPPIRARTNKLVPVRDELGRFVYSDRVEYGDITSTVVSPFEMHFPPVHSWDSENMGWVLREYYTPKEALYDKYGPKPGLSLKKSDGWNLNAIEEAESESIQDLPIWWWERITQAVEGNGPNLYIGDPTLWNNHVVVRILDRKPSSKWPRGRTIITVGSKVLYDSPKKIGARAYDPRWPTRWHPYVHFRWEAMTGSPWGRSLVTKLLPHLKRVNAIDTTLIMYRRTVPIASWILPKGASPQEGMFSGRTGTVISYDPRITNNQKPEPIYPHPFPREIVEERIRLFQEMEVIAGTEEILRGQRPVGVDNAAMLNILRKQALASRSSILQYWDEGHEKIGSIFNQETIKHIANDPIYAERLRIIAREKSSRLTIASFSGADLSDNVQVRVDTASMALVHREAEEAKAIEFLQFSSAIPNLDPAVVNLIMKKLGYDKALEPKGADVERAKLMISWIKHEMYDNLIPLEYDDPYVFFDLLVKELKSENFMDLKEKQKLVMMGFTEYYKNQVEQREQARMQMMLSMQQQGIKPGGQ